jgi:sulfide:quinone oxidoreductase
MSSLTFPELKIRQGIVVANNISAQIKGKRDRKYHFTGRLRCSMETGYNQATFVIGTYKKPVQKIYPSYANYLKKKFMSKIYWASEKGKFEWLFRLNFGEDYDDIVQNAPMQLIPSM